MNVHQNLTVLVKIKSAVCLAQYRALSPWWPDCTVYYSHVKPMSCSDLWMSLRQWLRAGHFMRQAFDSEIWKRHQSAYSTTELARSVHYSQLILQLSWMQLSTVMVSSWVQAHSAPTHSHHQESHNHCVRQAGAGGWSWNGMREKYCWAGWSWSWWLEWCEKKLL